MLQVFFELQQNNSVCPFLARTIIALQKATYFFLSTAAVSLDKFCIDIRLNVAMSFFSVAK